MATTAVVAGGGGGTTTVVVAGSVANVKYCGIKTHVIAWFFPCIACCPIDELAGPHEDPMADDEKVLYAVKDGVAWLTLNEPPANCYSHGLMRAL